jgi:hypothetical protein
MTLEEFLLSDYRNQYISYKSLEVYVRKNKHYLNHKLVSSIDLANIKNLKRMDNIHYNPKRRRTGLLREFDTLMKDLATKYSYDGIYVENVINDFLPQKLKNLGYEQLGEEFPYCFWYGITAEI